MSRALGFWVALLMMFAGGVTVWLSLKHFGDRSPSGAIAVHEPEPVSQPLDALSEFEFIDQEGKPFRSQDLDGKVWIGSFFFADCSSLCVTQNNEIKKLHRRFADQGLTVVSITVTPEKDPPHKLRRYAERFTTDRSHWRFLTGRDIDYVRQVGIDIFALTAADETHTAHVAVFDRSGQRRGVHKVTAPDEYEKLVRLIDKLLAESSSTDGASADPAPSTADI